MGKVSVSEIRCPTVVTSRSVKLSVVNFSFCIFNNNKYIEYLEMLKSQNVWNVLKLTLCNQDIFFPLNKIKKLMPRK